MASLLLTCVFLVGTRTAQAQDITTGLISHWKLDEIPGSSVAVDSVGGNDLTLTNMNTATVWGAGNIDGSITLQDNDDFATRSGATSTSLNITDNTMTIAAWVRRLSPTIASNIFVRGGVGAGVNGYLFSFGPGACRSDQITFTKFWLLNACFNGAPIDTNWHHVAVVVDTNGMRAYVDGTLVDTHPDNRAILTSSQPAMLGVTGTSSSISIDDLRIYDCALTAADIAVLASKMSANFYSGGHVVIGATTDTCDSSREGAIRWNNTSKMLEACNGTSWGTVIQKCNVRPDDMQFYDQTNTRFGLISPNNFRLDSNIEQVTGIGCAFANISIAGAGNPQYRICADAFCDTVFANWTNLAGQVYNNQYVQLRMEPGGVPSTTRSMTLTIGGHTENWSLTSEALPGSFKYIFGLVSPSSGNIGGVAGADTACNNAAAAASLPGTYMAWIATGPADDPESRFTKFSGQYRSTFGHILAHSWEDVTDGGLSGAYFRADGTGMSGGKTISNVNADGTAKNNGTNNCNNWTSSSSGVNGHFGTLDGSGIAWTDNSTVACNGYTTLLCFQQ